MSNYSTISVRVDLEDLATEVDVAEFLSECDSVEVLEYVEDNDVFSESYMLRYAENRGWKWIGEDDAKEHVLNDSEALSSYDLLEYCRTSGQTIPLGELLEGGDHAVNVRILNNWLGSLNVEDIEEYLKTYRGVETGAKATDLTTADNQIKAAKALLTAILETEDEVRTDSKTEEYF